MGRSGRMGMFARPGSADVKRCDEVIERLGISKLRGKRCSEISGGELQMVLIARALAAEPGLLILDEPESNLDFRNQLIVLRTMSELAAEGMGCIFNTHFPAHALQRANRALLLGRDGRALFGGAGAAGSAPTTEISEEELAEENRLLAWAAKVGLFKSNGEARKAMQQGGLYVGDDKATDPEMRITKEMLEGGLLIRRGKKAYHLLTLKK